MELQGKLTEEEVFKAIENNLILRTMKSVVEDEAYEDTTKYLILEGILSTWGNEKSTE